MPLDARTSCIAAGGEFVVSLRVFPTEKNKVQGEYHIGFEPDELDFIALTADSRIASSPTVPRLSVHPSHILNSNPI